MPEVFHAALTSYLETPHPVTGALPSPNPADRAHLDRWRDDDRADEVSSEIASAARERQRVLPTWFFIEEMLGARRIAELQINHPRKQRDRFRKLAAQMEQIANFLREPVLDGFPLIPSGAELARMLEDAARRYRAYVAPSGNVPGQIRWTRKSKPSDVFMSQVSYFLHGITGRWLDHEVAVLTQIAFDDPNIDDEQVF
jgi:hypothetical protein